jgi:hypothetical protein
MQKDQMILLDSRFRGNDTMLGGLTQHAMKIDPVGLTPPYKRCHSQLDWESRETAVSDPMARGCLSREKGVDKIS